MSICITLSETKALVLGPGGAKSSSSDPVISNVAEPIWLKLSEMVVGMGQNVLVKDFFEKIEK